MDDPTAKPRDQADASRTLAIGVAGLLGQVGCVTLILVGIALGAGLWLDTQLDSRPVFTIVFLLGSVPISLYLMVRVVLSGMSRLQSNTQSDSEE